MATIVAFTLYALAWYKIRILVINNTTCRQESAQNIRDYLRDWRVRFFFVKK